VKIVEEVLGFRHHHRAQGVDQMVSIVLSLIIGLSSLHCVYIPSYTYIPSEPLTAETGLRHKSMNEVIFKDTVDEVRSLRMDKRFFTVSCSDTAKIHRFNLDASVAVRDSGYCKIDGSLMDPFFREKMRINSMNDSLVGFWGARSKEIIYLRKSEIKTVYFAINDDDNVGEAALYMGGGILFAGLLTVGVLLLAK